MWKKRVAVLAFLSAGTLTACGGSERAVMDTTVPVEAETIQNGTLEAEGTFMGVMTDDESVSVTVMTSGTVEELNVEVGDQVEAGDVLCRLDDTSAQLSLASAQASYQSAQANKNAATGGSRDLSNYQTEEQINQMRSTVNDAESDLDDLQDDLDDIREAGQALADSLAAAQASASGLNTEMTELQARKQNLEAEIAAAAETEDVSEKLLELESVEKDIALKQDEYDETQQNIQTISSQIAANDSAKASAKSGISSLEDSIDTAREDLAAAENSYAITQNEVYPQTDETYEAQLESASVGVESAEYQLSLCTISAPVSGIVEKVNVSLNNLCSSGTVAFVVTNPESRAVEFYVSDLVAAELQEGQAVTVVSNGKDYEGAVSEIGVAIDASTGLFLIKATVYDGMGIANGTSVEVRTVTHRAENMAIVPADAVYFENNESYIYLVEDGTAVKTPVTVELYGSDQAALDGVQEGQEIITSWAGSLKDKASVRLIGEEDTEEEAEETTETAEEETSETAEEETSETTEEETSEVTE